MRKKRKSAAGVLCARRGPMRISRDDMREIMIVSTSQLLERAAECGFAVPALNVDNLESVKAVLEVSAELNAPVIVQTIPATLRYGGEETYVALVRALYKGGADIALHLDHGGDEEICARCVGYGYTSVMIDGSALPFEDNVALTSRVVKYAHRSGVAVEGELGCIGGKEETAGKVEYTDPDQAAEFVARTGVDSLAIGVGTAHGVYHGTPHIAIDRIEEIAAKVHVSLVLHGASGLSDEVIRASIAAGIRKINFATQLRQAFTAGIKKGMELYPDAFDPKKYMPVAIDEIRDAVRKIIAICGAADRG